MPKSFAPEVIADSTGKWCGNSLRFATREEAEQNVQDLMMRWTSVRETRVVESDDPVNYRYTDRKLVKVEEEPKPPLICCICELPIPAKGTWTHGNNAEPVVKNGRCCDECDNMVVIPTRIALIVASRRESKS